jgi:hypothetical protein
MTSITHEFGMGGHTMSLCARPKPGAGQTSTSTTGEPVTTPVGSGPIGAA